MGVPVTREEMEGLLDFYRTVSRNDTALIVRVLDMFDEVKGRNLSEIKRIVDDADIDVHLEMKITTSVDTRIVDSLARKLGFADAKDMIANKKCIRLHPWERTIEIEPIDEVQRNVL